MSPISKFYDEHKAIFPKLRDQPYSTKFPAISLKLLSSWIHTSHGYS